MICASSYEESCNEDKIEMFLKVNKSHDINLYWTICIIKILSTIRVSRKAIFNDYITLSS